MPSGWPCRWPGRWSRTWPSSTARASAPSSSPDQPRHRRGGPGARAVRAHPGAWSARPAPSGPGPARGAVPGRLAPRGRTRLIPDPDRGAAVPGHQARRGPAARDQADEAGQDIADFDELIGELDEEITKSGVRGNVAPPACPAAPVDPPPPGRPGPAPAQGQPPDGRQDLHRPDGKTFRPSHVHHPDLPVLRPGRPPRACRSTRPPTTTSRPPGTR